MKNVAFIIRSFTLNFQLAPFICLTASLGSKEVSRTTIKVSDQNPLTVSAQSCCVVKTQVLWNSYSTSTEFLVYKEKGDLS